MKIISSSPIITGYAIAQGLYYDSELTSATFSKVKDTTSEISKLHTALAKTKIRLQQLHDYAVSKASNHNTEISDWKAKIQLLHDVTFINKIISYINDNQTSAAFAVQIVTQHHIANLKATKEAIPIQQVKNIHTVFEMVNDDLLHRHVVDFQLINKPCIIIAHDIKPSTVVKFNSHIKGIITEKGTKTSHTTIAAANLKIPFVSGIANLKQQFANRSQEIILDGFKSEIIICPNQTTIAKYQQLQVQQKAFLNDLEKYAKKASKTIDGVCIPIYLNASSLAEYQPKLANLVEGIGLYRTELLFMNATHWPTISEQVQNYENILKVTPHKFVAIRTLDIGGDNNLPYHNFPHEDNPALGYRAIRFCLDNLSIFKTQLKALLIANKWNNLKIMFPMIASVSEIIQVKKILNDLHEEFDATGDSVSRQYQTGIAIETPAGALLADHLIKYVNYLSIGSNDLTQYSVAADRLNPKLSVLYNNLNPGVIRMFKMIIEAAHKNNKICSVAGSAGGDTFVLPLLIGLKIDTISISINRVPIVKKIINSLKVSDCEKLVNSVINLQLESDIKKKIKLFIKNNNLSLLMQQG